MLCSGTAMLCTLSRRNTREQEIQQVRTFSFLIQSTLVCLTTFPAQVMYIPAVPLTPQNGDYIKRQKENFLQGQRPPDFAKGPGEQEYIGVASISDVLSQEGQRAMGLVETRGVGRL